VGGVARNGRGEDEVVLQIVGDASDVGRGLDQGGPIPE